VKYFLNNISLLWCYKVTIKVNGKLVLSNTTSALRNTWEETSFELDRQQTNPVCVLNEQKLLQSRLAPSYFVSFDPESIISRTVQLRSEGFAPDLSSSISNLLSFYLLC